MTALLAVARIVIFVSAAATLGGLAHVMWADWRWRHWHGEPWVDVEWRAEQRKPR